MTNHQQPQSSTTPSAGRKSYAAWLVLLLGLVLTALAAFFSKLDVERIAGESFANSCGKIHGMIGRRLDDHARILLGGAALFRVTDEVTREQWRVFTQYQHFDRQLPGILGVGFAQVVPAAELARHVERVRREGFPEYQLKPQGERESYTAIIYLEPFVGRNLRAFGYDMFSEPVRRQAMQRACDTNGAALTGMVTLVQEAGEDIQPGTLMYVPVYRHGLPVDTIAQRRDAIAGWVYSPYRMNDLITGILSGHQQESGPQPELQIFDGEEVSLSNKLYGSASAPFGAKGQLSRQLPLAFNGHRWVLRFTQARGGLFTADYIRLWQALGLGLLISGLLFALVRVLIHTRAAAQRMAAELTIELRQTSNRLSLAARAGGVGIWDYDVPNNRLVWDEQMFVLYGITPDQFGGAYEAWRSGLHPDDRERGDEAIRLALRAEKEFDIEFRVRWPDGTTHNIRGFATVERDALGQPLRMIGTNWDISAQKLTEKALLESEGNFRMFFETMTDMIMVGTLEGRILFTNSAVNQMLAYTPAELSGMHLLDLHPANRRQEAEAIFTALFRGEQESCPLPLERKDRTLVPVETRVWFGQWNGENCVFGICKNLTAEQEAQQRFERLFRRNPSLIALSSLADRQFTDVNDAFLETLGYTREDIIGKSAADLDLFVEPAGYAAAAAQLQADGVMAGLELQVRCQDGRILDGLFSGEIISSQGRDYMLSVMIDITQRQHAERELARLSGIQRELMDLASDFVNVPLERQDVAIDLSLQTMGRLIRADRAYLFAYDFTAGIMSNTHEWCNAGITPEIANLQALPNDMLPDWVAAHRRGELVHVPSVAALPGDGYLRQILEPQGIRSLITLPLMFDEACLGFVGFDAVSDERVWQAEEISLLRVLAELYSHFEARRGEERKSRELQLELIQARDAAQAAALAKSLFMANMSHEIRTPLNAILGYSQIMERECRTCLTGQPLRAINRSAEHLLELLTDLLELVRSDVHQVALAPQTFDFYQSLEDVRLMFVRQTQAQGLTLELSRAADLPRFIHADPGKVRQILVNLIGNAIKFTSCGGVRLSATVAGGGAADGMTITVDVEDSGCGIERGDWQRIFDVFEQAEHGRKSGKGAGLGLPLSRRYARALGGDVTVTSDVGHGSCFRFTFQAQVESGSGVVAPSSCANVRQLSADQGGCQVLVVDDEAENREMLASMLREVGFTVETVASAAQALAQLQHGHGFQLAMFDVHMPEMDGYQALRRLRAMPGGRELPVLVVTASAFAEEQQLAQAAGADGFIVKPVRRELVLEEISRVTGMRYDYEPVAPEAILAMTDAALAAAARDCLNPAQHQQLNQALHSGDIKRLRSLIAAIGGEHGGVAAAMLAMVNAYDYDRLRGLLGIASPTTSEAGGLRRDSLLPPAPLTVPPRAAPG